MWKKKNFKIWYSESRDINVQSCVTFFSDIFRTFFSDIENACAWQDGGYRKEAETFKNSVFRVQNSQLSLPQKFFGQLTTLLFTGGKSTISLTRKRDSFGMTTDYDQSGFISSDPYEPPSSSRHTNITLHSPDPKLATFKVSNVATTMVNGSRLTLTSYMNEMVLLQMIIDTSNTVVPNSTLRFPGTSLSVEYYPSIADTGAFYMNFQVIKLSSTNLSLMILIFLLC
nr:hypothetical protein T05E12.5 - Caenorhabditis elegans [Caenorhabditis elegans]